MEPETRVLPIQRSWAATTAYLQTRKGDVNLSISSLCNMLITPQCVPLLTLELQHHVTQVCLDVEFIVGR